MSLMYFLFWLLYILHIADKKHLIQKYKVFQKMYGTYIWLYDIGRKMFGEGDYMAQ